MRTNEGIKENESAGADFCLSGNVCRWFHYYVNGEGGRLVELLYLGDVLSG